MYQEIKNNKLKTWLIMLGFFVIAGLVAFFGYLITGSKGTIISVMVGSLVYSIISYFAASKTALALNGAKEITKKDAPKLFRIVENISITTGMPMPKVYIMDDPAPNAFATGRNPQKAYVCATTGLLNIMNDSELEGVMAHEMGHVQNYDIRVNMIAFALVSIISMLSDIILRMTFFGRDDRENSSPVLMVIGLVGLVIAPIAASLTQLAISRKREYLADATGALTTRYPEGLASALQKISEFGSVTQKHNGATAHMFFANPLKAKNLTKLFSTHPPIKDRIAKLKGMNLNG